MQHPSHVPLRRICIPPGRVLNMHIVGQIKNLGLPLAGGCVIVHWQQKGRCVCVCVCVGVVMDTLLSSAHDKLSLISDGHAF